MQSIRLKSFNWTRDELILALDLFFRREPRPTSAADPDVIELSDRLRSLSLIPVDQQPENYRNPASVLFKLLNFQHLAPEGGAGYANVAAADRAVWAEFANDIPRLQAVAVALALSAGEGSTLPEESDEELEAPEGRILFRMHRSRERNFKLVQARKAQAKQLHGVLACEACGFDFTTVYGALGEGYIECHHSVPLSRLAPGQTTKVSDLALVCANCHRMLHKGGQLLNLATLRQHIADARAIAP